MGISSNPSAAPLPQPLDMPNSTNPFRSLARNKYPRVSSLANPLICGLAASAASIHSTPPPHPLHSHQDLCPLLISPPIPRFFWITTAHSATNSTFSPGRLPWSSPLKIAIIPFAVLSNTTTSPAKIRANLLALGMPIDEEKMYTASAAAAEYVIEKFPAPRIFNLATQGIADLLEGKAQWVQTSDQPCDAVICGAPANRFATPERQRLALKLLRSGAELIGICADRVYTSPRGIEIGVGALTHLLAYAANISPTFTGKPNRIFFDHLCQRLNVAPSHCILIGDNLESDVAGAAALNMKTILPLTGVTHIEDIEKLPLIRRPNWIIKDLTELL